MQGTCTILFEDPFWVGIFERTDEDGYRVARFVFGAEPTSAQLLEFALWGFQKLQFSSSQSILLQTVEEVGFKRRQRQILKQMRQVKISTHAQQVLQAELELHKKIRQNVTKAEKDTEAKNEFVQRAKQKKEKHRGH